MSKPALHKAARNNAKKVASYIFSDLPESTITQNKKPRMFEETTSNKESDHHSDFETPDANINIHETYVSTNEKSNFEVDELNDKLAAWATMHLISIKAMNELLSILKVIVPDLPSDIRTLKKTSSSFPVVKMDSGSYIHYGLKDGLTDFLINSDYKNPIISLDFNIDDLPVSKSSSKQVWPILVTW